MRLYSHYPLTELQIKIILADRAKKGFGYVNFTGGEPTLFPKFIELLVFAKKLGYKIYVGTNGTLLAQSKFAQEFLNYVDILSISIHWFDSQSCLEQTGDSLHFLRFKDICKNVAQLKKGAHYYQSNIVINAKNYTHLLDIIKNMLDSGYPVDHILVSYVAPEGMAKKNYSNLVIEYSNVVSYINESFLFCQSKGIQFRIFGIPLCVLGRDLYSCSNDVYWKERNTIERFTNSNGKVTLIDIYSPDNSRERVFVEKCQSCIWKNNPCTGVFEEYLNYHSFL